jgi:hypothetical protein
MLRGDNLICGTSSTGAGDLTLAATPTAVGGVDFDVWLRATGLGFGNSVSVLVPYVIIEYTSSSYAVPKQREEGIAPLLLGGSSGIANCTLKRTVANGGTIQSNSTGEDTQPASLNVSTPGNITIGTAANTLVFIGPRAIDIPAYHPFFVSGLAGQQSNFGVLPDGFERLVSIGNSSGFVTGLRNYFQPFRWSVPMLAKRVSMWVNAVSTPNVAQLWVRLYAFGSDGRPGALLYDFVGATPLAPSTAGVVVTSGAAGNGFLMVPGDYYMEFVGQTTISGSFNLAASGAVYYGANVAAVRLGFQGAPGIYTGLGNVSGPTDTGAAPNPANLTGTALRADLPFVFGLSPT